MAREQGKYAIFAGGQSKYYDSLSEVDVYDENLTRTTPFTMLLGRCRGVSASLKGFMLCAGGTTDNSDEYVRNTVEVYDENLVKSQIDGLSQARMDLGSATVGDYILFASGYHYSSSTNYNIVDVYQVFE